MTNQIESVKREMTDSIVVSRSCECCFIVCELRALSYVNIDLITCVASVTLFGLNDSDECLGSRRCCCGTYKGFPFLHLGGLIDSAD